VTETKVWQILRDRQLLGLKFRRQHVIDGFIVDFYCPEYRLVLEIDGSVHSAPTARDYDEARTAHFHLKGLTVARIKNEDVSRKNLLDLIEKAIATADASECGSPLHESGEGTGVRRDS
jgi:very-short-patch-repair endonuclease